MYRLKLRKIHLSKRPSLLLLIFFCHAAISQQVFSGLVLDKEYGTPLPYVHISFPDYQERATITKTDGTFKIQVPDSLPSTARISLSCMGMKTMNATIQAGQPITLKMEPDPALLRTAYVGDFDYERFMVRRVIARIPINYPIENERISGVVTERGFEDSLKTIPLYRTTVQTKADKASYRRKNDFGNVSVVDGQTETFPAYKNSWVNIIAGVYNVHRFDIIAKRAGPLQASKVDSYTFENLGHTIFDGAEILRLGFKGRDAAGTLYINLEDTALVQAEIRLFKYEESWTNFLRDSNRRFLNYTVTYGAYKGRYRLRNILYETGFNNSSDQTFFLENTFTIENFGPVLLAIPESKTIGYYDVLVHQVPGIRLDSADNVIGTTITSSRFERFISSINSAFGVTFTPVNRSAFTITTPRADLTSYQVAEKTQLMVGSNAHFELKIYGRHRFGIIAGGFGEIHSLISYGYLYRLPLGFSGRQRLNLGIFYTEQHFARKIDQITLTDREKFGNRTLRAGQVDVRHTELQFALNPQISYDYGFSRRAIIRLSANWILPMGERHLLVFTEDRRWGPRIGRERLSTMSGRNYQSSLYFSLSLFLLGN
jgi:hypothetical protein